MTPDYIRPLRDDDLPGIADVFFHAVSQGAASQYSAAQRLAWGGACADADRWPTRLQGLEVWVAHDDARALTGFFSLRSADGLVGHMFVLPARQRSGLASRLLDTVETAARSHDLTQIWTQASLLARPFLQRRGWHVVREQHVALRGEVLRNFVMRTTLS